MMEGINLSEGWNFGPNDEDILTVEEVIKKAVSVWGKGKFKIDCSECTLHEANLLKLDISKSKLRLKWRPVYNSDKAIEETINWYKQFYENEEFDVREFSISQIQKYTQEAIINNIVWGE